MINQVEHDEYKRHYEALTKRREELNDELDATYPRMWVVEGHTGEYEDSREWIYGIYATQREAEKVCETLNAKLMLMGLHKTAAPDDFTGPSYPQELMLLELDVSAESDYNGVSYGFYPVYNRTGETHDET